MKFRDAIRHVEELGLTPVMPNGKRVRVRKKARFRNPIAEVPVRVVTNGAFPKELREMIRESRAQVQVDGHRPKRTRKNR